MQKFLIPFLLALMGANLAFAGDLPVFSLPEGTSVVALSVLNAGETDLSEDAAGAVIWRESRFTCK